MSDLVKWLREEASFAYHRAEKDMLTEAADRIEALEAEVERLTARVAELKEALASMVEYSRYNECWQDRHPEYIERARAALKEDTRHE